MARYRNALGFLALAALWGGSYPAIRVAVAGVDPLLLAALRFDAIGVVVLAAAVLAGRRVRPARVDLASVALGGVVLVGVHNGLLFTGQARVSGAVGAVVLATVPIHSVALSALVLDDEPLTVPRVTGVLLGLVGVGVLAAPAPGTFASPDTLGVVLLLGSALAFAAGAVGLRRLDGTLPVVSLQGWAMLVGGIVLHGASVAAGEPQTAAWTTASAAAFAYLVLGAGVAGYLLYFSLLDRLGPVEINLVGYVAPVFAAVVDWLVAAAAITPNTLVGFVVVFAGFVLVKRRAIAQELSRTS